MSHYVLVGHFAKDVLADGGHALGGTVFYSGVQAYRLGNRVSIISSCADDLSLDALPRPIQTYIHPAPHSTTFENVYDTQGKRTQYAHARALMLTPQTAPVLDTPPDILHLAPILDEVAPDYARAYPTSKVCITPQGWLRAMDATGRVYPKIWEHAETTLRGAYALVFSEEDMGYDEEKIEFYARLCPFTVCTRGGKPASLYISSVREEIEAIPTPIVDPTGAGDIFAAAFFTHLVETDNPREAVRVGHIAAASSIGARGDVGILWREDILDKLR